MQLSSIEPLLPGFPGSSSERSQRAIIKRIKEALAAADAETSRDIIEVLAHVGSVDDEALPSAEIPVPTSTLSVAEVADQIRQRSARSTDGLDELIERATAWEQRLLRSLRHSSAERSRESALIAAIAGASGWAPTDVRTAATALGSLSAAAEFVFTDSRDGRFEPAVEPGRAVMLMGPSPSGDIDEVVASGIPVVVEQLLDGDRIQAHRREGTVWLFDARGLDVTDQYPLVTSVVSGAARADLVLDGVVVRPGSSGVAPVHARFFDLLYDGESMIDRPLDERRSRLESLLPAEHRVPSIVTTETADIEAMLRFAVQHGHDGVMLKDLAAPYDGGPASPAWRLLRPVFTFSLVAIGAEIGAGKEHEFSVVHVAARSELSFVPVGVVTRGLTRSMLAWQSTRFRELAVDETVTPAPTNIRLRPDLVLDVRCNGVHLDDELPGGVRLDGPRVLRYRPDLAPTEATDLDQLRALVPDPSRRPAPDGSTGPPLLPPIDAPRLPPAAPLLSPVAAAEPAPPESCPTDGPTPGGLPPGRIRIAPIEYQPYEAPVLLESRWPARAVIAARAIALMWVIAITFAAWFESSSSVNILSRAGFVVLVTITSSGWWWTDHLTRNLKLLDGRLPSRVRSVSAWLVPAVVVVVLELTVARMEPTELFDIRPLLIGTLTALAFWRPYALVRRILATLIRIPHDALLSSTYVIDLAAFGLVWWSLSSRYGTPASVRSTNFERLVGVTGSAVLALALGAVLWVLLIRACDRAVDHRASSQRTRYDHRMLRLAGVDPTDPDVWWELVARRAREDRAAEVSGVEAAEAAAAPARFGPAAVDALVDEVRRTRAPELRRLGEERSEDLMVRLRQRIDSVVSSDDVADEIDAEAAATSDSRTSKPPSDFRTLLGLSVPEDDTKPAEAAEDGVGDGESTEEAGERTNGVPHPTPDEALGESADDDESFEDDLEASPPAEVGEPAVAAAPEAKRPAMSDAAVAIDPDLPLAQLLREAQAAQIEAALAEHRRSIDDKHADGERMVPPTLYALDAVRLLLVIVFACVTIATGWFMTLVLGANAQFGSTTASSVGELETARQTTIIAFLVATAIVPLWALLFSTYGRRAGGPGPSMWSAVAPLILGIGATTTGLLAHSSESNNLVLLTAGAAAIAAVVAALRIVPIRHWFDLRSHTLVAWVCIVPAFLFTAAISGLLTPIDSKDSLPLLAFVSVMLTLGSSLMTIFAALSSSDLQDEIRVTPSMAVSVHSRRSE